MGRKANKEDRDARISRVPVAVLEFSMRRSPRQPKPTPAKLSVAKLWHSVVARFDSMLWPYWRKKSGTFQPFNDTRPLRYPKFFRFVQRELGAQSALKILSFGCSTGEEVFSLRTYFPNAEVKGLDINPCNIAIARRRLKEKRDNRLSFEIASSTAAEPTAGYDAIFCMAVFRHGGLSQPGITRCDQHVRFEDFAAAVADFRRCLRPGGLLVIRHSNFRFNDTLASSDFETILKVPIPDSGDRTPIFGPNNQLLPGADNSEAVFRKRPE